MNDLNIKKISDNEIEYNGKTYTADQDKLHHDILKNIADRLIKLEKDTSFITSTNFADMIFGSSMSVFDGSGINIDGSNKNIQFEVNGRVAITDYRTILLIEKEKAILVKIVSKEKVIENYTDKKNLTKEELKQYNDFGFVVIVE